MQAAVMFRKCVEYRKAVAFFWNAANRAPSADVLFCFLWKMNLEVLFALTSSSRRRSHVIIYNFRRCRRVYDFGIIFDHGE